jgi:hypothetical protein
MRVAGAVGFERGPAAVVAEAVRLDDQAARAPEEVHFVLADASGHLRLGKAVAATEAEEDSLELATGEEVLAPDVRRAHEPQVKRPPKPPAEDRLGRGAVEVSERAARPRHRDAVAAGRNTGNEGVGSVDPDALPLLPAAVPRTVTSIGPECGLSIPHTAAALRWLATARAPRARTAATQRPSKLSRACPTA